VINIKELLNIPQEHRQVLQEVIGYTIANDMNLMVFSTEHKKMIDDRMKHYCSKKEALFTYDEIKTTVLDKLK
jgi:hypothetical protein